MIWTLRHQKKLVCSIVQTVVIELPAKNSKYQKIFIDNILDTKTERFDYVEESQLYCVF